MSSINDDNIIRLYSLLANAKTGTGTARVTETTRTTRATGTDSFRVGSTIERPATPQRPATIQKTQRLPATIQKTQKTQTPILESEFHSNFMKLKKKRIHEIKTKINRKIMFDIIISSIVITTAVGGIVCCFGPFKSILTKII